MTTRTLSFVDLAGFTALTEVHGDETAVDLVEQFVATVREALGESGVLVKTIGDAVMLSFDDPAAAIDAVTRIFEACYASDGLPEPRAGVHHGPVITRGDDLFGATVNLAARVASRAGSGQVLGTAPIAEAATALGVDTIPLGPQHLRNVLDPVDVWAIDVCPTHVDVSIDPVCRMRVGCQAAVGRIRLDGVEHWFCSLDCVRAFVADPGRYAASQH